VGKNTVRAYSRWFGVDRVCAIVELRMLRHKVNRAYEEAGHKTVAERARQRALRKERAHGEAVPTEDENAAAWGFAFIAGETVGGAPFGLTFEELEEMVRLEADEREGPERGREDRQPPPELDELGQLPF
jgi:hypothetical protein